jgi:hypothetical protein
MTSPRPGELKLRNLFQPGTIGRSRSANRIEYGACWIAMTSCSLNSPPGSRIGMLGRLKRRLRRGDIMLCTFRTRAQLAESGYEDFLDSLGLAFMGACR